MFTEFTNNELSLLSELVRRNGNEPLIQKLVAFLGEASNLGGMSLVNVRLVAEVS